jgi:hypothetical protein
MYLCIDCMAIWNKFIMNKTFVDPPDAEEDLLFSKRSLSLSLSLCDRYWQLSFIKPLLL